MGEYMGKDIKMSNLSKILYVLMCSLVFVTTSEASPRRACHEPTPEVPLFSIRYREQDPSRVKPGTRNLLKAVVTKDSYRVTHYIDNSAPFVAGKLESLGLWKPVVYGPENGRSFGAIITQLLYPEDIDEVHNIPKYIRDHWNYANADFLCPQVKWCKKRYRGNTLNSCFLHMKRRYPKRIDKFKGIKLFPVNNEWGVKELG